MNIDNIWNKFLSIMKTKLNSLSYDTWFSTSKLVELNEEHAVSLFQLSLIKNIYLNLTLI